MGPRRDLFDRQPLPRGLPPQEYIARPGRARPVLWTESVAMTTGSVHSSPDAEPVLVVDDPAPKVRRLTLNRPRKRNALSNDLRAALFAALRAGDADRDVSVIIIRGAGSCFSAGYDLAIPSQPVERAAAATDGWWSRHVVANWFEMWDMSTPIIAQVHGYCLAGGTELATACDLVYVT